MPDIETNEIQNENQDPIVEEALERLKRKLLDLSRRNSLLNFKAGRNSIRIVDELPDVIFEYLVNKGKGMVLNPLPDPEPEAENAEIKSRNISLFEIQGHEKEKQEASKTAYSDDIDTNHELPSSNGAESEKKHIDNKLQTDLVSQVLERRCKKITAESRRSIEESGINIFFLAIGFLEWYEDDHSDVKNKAPLILIPVSIEKTALDRETNCYRYVISYNEEDIETNLSLVEKLSINFNIILPTTEELTPEEYFVEISNAVTHKKRWRVAREAILGFFSFAKIRIYKDLCASDNGSGFIAAHPLVKQIIAGREREGKEYHVTGRVDDIDIDEYEKENAPLLLVREADSSQYSAIVDVVHNGKNLCIEGPPGTGKSQTITNIIANALCNNKSVLFVSEKKAALEVVRNRLNQHDLGDYYLELHSQKTQKIKLYEDLGRRLSIGNIPNPSNLDAEIKRLEEEKDKLKKYYDILHEKPAVTDDTIYDIFWKTDRWRSVLNTVPPHFSLEVPLSITNGTISELIRIVEDFVKLREELPGDIYQLWHGFEPNVLVPGDDEEIRLWLEELIESFKKFDSFFKEFIENHSFPELPFFSSVDRLSAIDQKIVSVPPDIPATIYQNLFDSNNTVLVNELSNKVREYKELTKEASQVWGESTPPIADLGNINSLVEKLRTNGLGELSIYSLQETYKTVVQPVYAALTELDCLLEEIKSFSAIHIENLCDFNLINRLSGVLSNSPADLAIHAYPEHSLKFAFQCFEKFRAEGNRLKSSFQNLAVNIKIEKETIPQELDAIAGGLEKGTSWSKRLFSSEYREAKKKCLPLLQDPHTFKKQSSLPQQLRKLAVLRSEEQTFSEEDDARKVLGPLFKGTNTDWGRLEKLICWCQSLSDKLLSEGKAKLFLANFNESIEKCQRILARTSELVTTIEDGATKLGISFSDDTSFINLKNEFTAKKTLIEEAQKFFVNLLTPTNCDFDTLAEGVQAALSAKDVYKNISSREHEYRQVLGELYQSVETDLALVLTATNWLDTQRKALLRESHIEWILEDKTGERVELLKKIISKAIHFHNDINNFKKRIETKGSIDFAVWAGLQDGHVELSGIAGLLMTKLSSVNYLMSWSEYNFTKQKFVEQKFEQLADIIEAGTIAPNEAVPYARYIIYQNMAKEIIKRYPDLATFQRVSYENIRGRIGTISETIKKLSEKRICHILANKSIPYGNGTGKKKDYTDLCLIMNEVSKKKRHVPIRQLISRARDALIAMKPCFMMSPLSVAQYLGPGLPFDLVVMDEASQLRLEDAIGAVARGKQLIVVGDPKQLPPSSFFQIDNIYTEVEEEEMTAAEDTESILDICQVNFETRRLKWHYRSAHESLIAFSNKEFYDNELVVFPSPYQGTNTLGMNYHFIDGAKYAKGKNRIEAQRVAMAVVDHFKKTPQLSLGVATFNTEQRDLINDELERIQKENRWLEAAIKETEDTEEPFFVKNLETVQGDERSVIMISTTYGPDINTGIVNQRFGPINRDTGWRRLNVIATRAKQRIDLFTSMKGSDIKVHPGSSRGVVALRKYLDFAEKGILADFGAVTGKEPDSDFEIAVMALLDRYGYKTAPQVGVAGFFIDIGVYNPYRENEFLCGIECDGATYHSTKSIKDRDVLRQQILESKGWDIYRIWSTDWFKNREREKDKLLSSLEQLAEKFRLSRPEQLVEEETLAYAEEKQKQDASLKKISEAISDYSPDQELREALSEYRQKRMTEKEASSAGCMLSDTMINLFIATMPVNSNEFLSKIPLVVRESLDTGQGGYLPEIFNIIEEYADL